MGVLRTEGGAWRGAAVVRETSFRVGEVGTK
ncbi:hypothetical protein ENSA7_04530 [Enhygromyxa salina]|uniref:Uncharacterized protein n=1 Tax=Enhygromyxa salina TaxID=215803 RepID=A0A2S9YXA6_9BACT|nr:hypothetical protein ENSA7_04530 [Enhygromyxa salina]